jgi:hypothetical protein
MPSLAMKQIFIILRYCEGTWGTGKKSPSAKTRLKSHACPGLNRVPTEKVGHFVWNFRMGIPWGSIFWNSVYRSFLTMKKFSKIAVDCFFPEKTPQFSKTWRRKIQVSTIRIFKNSRSFRNSFSNFRVGQISDKRTKLQWWVGKREWVFGQVKFRCGIFSFRKVSRLFRNCKDFVFDFRFVQNVVSQSVDKRERFLRVELLFRF